MKVRALAIRILNQLRHDRRTLALMLVAPLFLLTLVYFILGDSTTMEKVAVINAPAEYVNLLEKNNIEALRYTENAAKEALEKGGVVASINIMSGKSYIEVDGSNPTKAKIVLTALEKAKMKTMASRPDLQSEVNYVYGSEDLPTFDNFGATLIGFIVFFFVFLISGISFLQERTTGTLEKLLSMPIRRWEIVTGYILGFGLFTVIQAVLVSWYSVYVLKVMMIGSFPLVILIILMTAMIALSLGILASTAANNEFQMMQFIPIIIVPQIFFSGLFDLPPTIEFLGRAMPLYYVADALTEVMIKGSGFSAIVWDMAAILGCTVVFMIINTLLLKKYRRI